MTKTVKLKKKKLLSNTNVPGGSAIVSLWFCISLAHHCEYPPKCMHKNDLKEFEILHFNFSRIFFSRDQSFSLLIE